jgi:hypothetical protein
MYSWEYFCLRQVRKLLIFEIIDRVSEEVALFFLKFEKYSYLNN